MRMRVARNRKATNLSLDASLVAEARALDINLSQEFETHLAQLIRQRRGSRWRTDNQAAFESYEKFFEKHGVWNEDSRFATRTRAARGLCRTY